MATLSISDDLRDGFETVLRHCALDGAVRVIYSKSITDNGSKAALKYYDRLGKPIGDDRDYDVLKSCFGRLDTLERTLTKRLIEDEDENNNMTVGEACRGLKIDLDLVSGQMSVSAI